MGSRAHTSLPLLALLLQVSWTGAQNSGVGTRGYRKGSSHWPCLSWDEGRGEELSSLAETGEEGT